MNHTQEFVQHLSQKGKKQTYIDMSRELIDSFYRRLGDQPPSSAAIDSFVRSRWSGYVNRDKAAYQILNEYSDFCETECSLFTNAFRKHIRETFEGEARKAMKAYKNAIVCIPQGLLLIDIQFFKGKTIFEVINAYSI